MIIFGRRLSDYVAFCRVFLVLIFLAGLVRLVLSVGGAPNTTARWFTMSGLVWIGVVYYSIRVHTSGFGSYKQLLVICALQNLVAQAVAIVGIMVAMATGVPNVFSSPEYSFGNDGATWSHLGAHLLIGTTVGSLVPWLFGSLVLFVTSRLKPGPELKKHITNTGGTRKAV
jgi:hypothetical protein